MHLQLSLAVKMLWVNFDFKKYNLLQKNKLKNIFQNIVNDEN